jgi:hypothetical protein
MPYTVRHDADARVIETVWTGAVTPAELRTSTSECIALQRQTGITRFIVDIAKIEPGLSLVDLFAMPDEQYSEQALDRTSCIAIVRPLDQTARRNADFYENACRNRGWMARSFDDRSAALQWLASSSA